MLCHCVQPKSSGVVIQENLLIEVSLKESEIIELIIHIGELKLKALL